MKLFDRHGPGHGHRRETASGAARQSALAPENPLGVGRPASSLVIERGNVLFEQALKQSGLYPISQGSSDRIGYEGITLDVAPVPGERLKTRFHQREASALAMVIPVQDHQPPGPPFGSPFGSKMGLGASRPATTQNHHPRLELKRQGTRKPASPDPQNAFISGTFDI